MYKKYILMSLFCFSSSISYAQDVLEIFCTPLDYNSPNDKPSKLEANINERASKLDAKIKSQSISTNQSGQICISVVFDTGFSDIEFKNGKANLKIIERD